MFKDRKHTPETKLKMRLAALGRKNSAETRKKISLNHAHAWKGRKHTEEEKKKIGNAHKGKFVSKETCEKLGGANHYNWKGGVTPIYFQIRNCSLYRQWRLNIFRRDLFACLQCGDDRGHNLNADHIKPFSVIMQQNNIKTLKQAEMCDELWDISNGQTLCESCHVKTPTFGQKALNYKT